MRIAHQFPGNGRGFGDRSGDLDPQFGELFADGEPDGPRPGVAVEDFGVQLLAASPHQNRDLLSGEIGTGAGDLEIFFEIPAEVFLLLLGEGELDFGPGREFRLLVAAQPERDGVSVVMKVALLDVKSRHAVNAPTPDRTSEGLR